MPRRNRCVLPGIPCHITQRGVDRRETFSSPHDRLTYLRLVEENLEDSQARVLACCLVTNHIHLIAVPAREDSLTVLLRRAHGRYARYYNTSYGRGGHLWQNRFSACALQQDHLPAAVSYVEQNPVRAAIASHPGEYPWSSAAVHLTGTDTTGILDVDWWRREAPRDWAEVIGSNDPDADSSLRRCTYSGRPFGNDAFVDELSRRFGRYWTRGRPPKSGARKLAGRSVPALCRVSGEIIAQSRLSPSRLTPPCTPPR